MRGPVVLDLAVEEPALSIVLGLGTAFAFAAGLILSARLSRQLPPTVVVAAAAVAGLLLLLPFSVSAGIPPGLGVGDLALLGVAGLGGLGGLVCVNAALRVGKVGVVGPIVATQGALTVAFSLAAGRPLEPLLLGLLTVIAVGIVIAARARETAPVPHERPARSVVLALLSAACFALSLLSTGLLSDDLPLAWIALPGRVVTTAALAIPLLAAGRLRVPRRTAPLIVALALCDLIGLTLYSLGADLSIEITAVMASQMAPIAAVLALLLFGERLTRTQVIGLVVIVVGVAGLSLVQAMG